MAPCLLRRFRNKLTAQLENSLIVTKAGCCLSDDKVGLFRISLHLNTLDKTGGHRTELAFLFSIQARHSCSNICLPSAVSSGRLMPSLVLVSWGGLMMMMEQEAEIWLGHQPLSVYHSIGHDSFLFPIFHVAD